MAIKTLQLHCGAAGFPFGQRVFMPNSQLSIDSDKRIINAALIFTLKEKTVTANQYMVMVMYENEHMQIIDRVNPTVNSKFSVNVTEEVICGANNPNDDIFITLDPGLVVEDDVILAIEYVSEHLMVDETATIDIDAHKAGSGKICLATGKLRFNRGFGATGVALTYNDSETSNSQQSRNHHCGNGWKLNLEQSLVKTVDEQDREVYTYVDGQGNYHEFSEKYYYVVGDVKRFIDKGAVNVDLYGKLTTVTDDGSVADVKLELRSTAGLTLETDYAKFNGGKYLELRQQEQIELEESVAAYMQQFKEYVVVSKVNGEYDESHSLKEFVSDNQLSTDSYNAFVQQAENDDKLLLTRSEALQYNSLLLQQTNQRQDNVGKTVSVCSYVQGVQYSDDALEVKSFDSQNGYDNTLVGMQSLVKDLRKDLTTLTKKSNYANSDQELKYLYDEFAKYSAKTKNQQCHFENVKNYLVSPDELFEENPQIEHLKNGACDLEAELQRFEEFLNAKPSTDEDTNQQYDAKKIVAEEKEAIEKDISAFEKEFNNRVEKLQQNITQFEGELNDYLTQEQGQLIDSQIDSLIERSAINKLELDKYFKQYVNKQHELNLLYLQLPTRYITSGNGVTMGFNRDGQLVALFDNYDNQTAIIYENGKIIRVQDSNNKVTEFNYENDLLSQIIFADEKVVKFSYYKTGELKVIVDDEGETKYFYNNGLLQRTQHSYGRGIKLTRDSYNRIVSIEETSSITAVEDNDAKYDSTSQLRVLAQLNYNNSHLTTTVTDRLGVTKTYKMDILGKPITVYEGKFSDPESTTRSLSFDYIDSHKSFSIAEDISLKNHLADQTESIVLQGDRKSICQYVFSSELNQAEQPAQFIDLEQLSKEHSLVFSAWVKADSAYVPNARNPMYFHRDIDQEFGVEIDNIKQRRKFELRAELTYNGVDEPEIVSATCDWLCTGWQFVALPIEIKTMYGDALPAEFPFAAGDPARKLASIKLIVDYSYNTGNIEFACCSLRAGNWSKKEYYSDGKVKSLQDSSSRSTTVYKYDKDDKLVAEELTDYQGRTFTTKYEYNKQGSLIRSTAFDGTVSETVFDEKGRELKRIVYNVDDPTSMLYSESKRDEKGVITADVDESGEYDSVTYTYDHNGEVTAQADGKGNKTACGYRNGALVSVSGSTDGEESANTLSYTAGLLTKVSCGGTEYKYAYDKWGRTAKIEIGGAEYASINVVSDFLTETTLANGDEYTTKTDQHGNTVKQTVRFDCGAGEKVANIYNPETNRLDKTTVDIIGGQAYNIQYNYDEVDGKLLSSVRSGDYGFSKTNAYTADGELQSTVYEVEQRSLAYTYETDGTPDKRNTKVGLPFELTQQFAYDGLGRTKAISLGDNLVKDIYYAKYGDHATNRVNSVWHGLNGVRKDNTKYTYDKAGNIETIAHNGKLAVRYAYDGLNRLVREDNAQFGTFTYTYDVAGNILTKTEYAYTLNDTLGQELSVREYAYKQHGWKDQLVSFNGEQCSYDALGNPVLYRNGAMTWQGRRLMQYQGIAYTYDVNGIRTSKTRNGVTYKYIYDGNNLIAEQHRQDGASEWLYYIYGVDGVVGFNYNDETYVYGKNIQGDVTHIYKQLSDGKLQLVAQYVYDAWGNHKVLDAQGEVLDSTVNCIANTNPFRYRSYYYDSETNLYYLQTRYYDSELGRFISSDSLSYLKPGTLAGLNLYAYCGNNPVMAVDSTGTDFWDFLRKAGKFIGGAILVCVGKAGALVGLSMSATPFLGGTITHLGTALAAYGGIMIASIFDAQVQKDMDAIEWKPFNTKAEVAANSEKVSFYRGMPVIKFSDPFLASFQVGGIIFFEGKNDIALKHESGHGIQEAILGLPRYLTHIAFPSVVVNVIGRFYDPAYDFYYNFPWERTADWFGGVGTRTDHVKGSLTVSIIYFILSIIF